MKISALKGRHQVTEVMRTELQANFRIADNPLGGFHAQLLKRPRCPQYCDAGQAQEGYNVCERGKRRCAHGFASRTQKFNESRRPGGD